MLNATKSSEKTRNSLGWFLGVLVSVVLLAMVLAGIDWSILLLESHQIRWIWLPVLMALTLAFGGIRVLRWRMLLPRGQEWSLVKLFEAMMVGLFAVALFPLRAGELVRPWLISRRQPVTFSAAFASSVTERMFDLLALLSLTGLALLKLDHVPRYVLSGVVGLVGIAAVLLVLIVACYRWPDWFRQWSQACIHAVLRNRHPRLSAKLLEMSTEFLAGLRVISTWRELLLVLLWTYVSWLVSAFWYQVGLWAFGRFPGFRVGLLVNSLVALAVAAPAGPAHVGTYQAGCVVALTVMGPYAREFAIVYSVFLQILELVTLGLCAAIVLRAARITLGSLISSASTRGER